jgi:hypothetical protein
VMEAMRVLLSSANSFKYTSETKYAILLNTTP